MNLLLIYCIAGNSTVCSVTISGVEESDHGEWTCALSDNLSLDTVKDRVGLGVVVSQPIRAQYFTS